MSGIRFDIENYTGAQKCPCCGIDVNGDKWGNCVDVVRDLGMDQSEACAKFCTVTEDDYGDLCNRCESLR